MHWYFAKWSRLGSKSINWFCDMIFDGPTKWTIIKWMEDNYEIPIKPLLISTSLIQYDFDVP